MFYDYVEAPYTEMVDAWNMFMDTGAIHRGVPCPDTYTSWIRCCHKEIYANPISTNKYDEKHEDNSSLIANSKQIMADIDSMLNKKLGNNYAIILLDAVGSIIDLIYSSSDIVSFINHCSETYACYNAINIATNEKKSMEVYGYDHLYSGAVNWHTIGTPIFNFDNSLAGGLGIVCQSKSISSLVPIARIGAQFIQSNLVLEQIAKNKIGILLKEIPTAVTAINEHGVILNANEKFSDLLNIPLENLIGQNVSDYIAGNINCNALYYSLEEFNGVSNVSIKSKRKPHSTIEMKKCIVGNFDKHPLILLSFNNPQAQNMKAINTNDMTNDDLYSFDDLLGESDLFVKVKNMAQKAAKSSFNILIEGESGTGKELMAQSIHRASQRKGPFVAINCGSLSKELLQSELFGYEDGAFTGAKKGGNPGKFELADGGSIFLDEIGEMPMDMQVSLLRCLQEKSFTRVGGTHIKKVDVRIIAATNRNIYEEVKKGNFREDLYYRLNVIDIKMPPLRERIQDLSSLSSHILNKLCQELKLSKAIQVSTEAMECFQHYEWPGNVRELQNVLERAIIYMNGHVISSDCLPAHIKQSNANSAVDSNGRLEEYEKIAITKVIRKNQGNLSKSAMELGIARSTLYQKINKLSIAR